ncbi:MAG: hypothetical protein RIQ93_48 [Verrucomicrobiota bacterium]|jgi:hypothetical protein
MLRDLAPRYFDDTTVPLRPDGSPINPTLSDGDFRTYVDWLADYLVIADLPLHPRQHAYAAATDSQSPGDAVFRIGDAYGYAFFELDMMESHIAAGGTWDEWNAIERQDWEQRDVEVWAHTTFEETCLDRDTFARLEDEWAEEQRLGTRVGHADIPYRALLARILQRVPARAERIKILDRFFENYGDNTLK